MAAVGLFLGTIIGLVLVGLSIAVAFGVHAYYRPRYGPSPSSAPAIGAAVVMWILVRGIAVGLVGAAGLLSFTAVSGECSTCGAGPVTMPPAPAYSPEAPPSDPGTDAGTGTEGDAGPSWPEQDPSAWTGEQAEQAVRELLETSLAVQEATAGSPTGTADGPPIGTPEVRREDCGGGANRRVVSEEYFIHGDTVAGVQAVMDMWEAAGWVGDPAAGSVTYHPGFPSPIEMADIGSNFDSSVSLRIESLCVAEK